MKLDQGLGTIGLLALATVLATLLSIGIPVIAASEPIKIADWLGFAGGFAGAMVTLIAAGIAWNAVQKQIEVQQKIANRQLSIDALNILIRQAETLEREQRLIAGIELFARSANSPVVNVDDSRKILVPSFARGIELDTDYSSDAERLKTELSTTADRIWAMPEVSWKRVAIEKSLMLVSWKISDSIYKLKELSKETLKNVRWREVSVEDINYLDRSKECDTLVNACETYLIDILAARETLYLKAAKIRMELDI